LHSSKTFYRIVHRFTLCLNNFLSLAETEKIIFINYGFYSSPSQFIRDGDMRIHYLDYLLGGLLGTTKMQTHSLPANVDVIKWNIKLTHFFLKIIFINYGFYSSPSQFIRDGDKCIQYLDYCWEVRLELQKWKPIHNCKCWCYKTAN
jgi:hypothetical protein